MKSFFHTSRNATAVPALCDEYASVECSDEHYRSRLSVEPLCVYSIKNGLINMLAK